MNASHSPFQDRFRQFLGGWRGTSRTWFAPNDPPEVSEWVAQCEPLLGSFLLMKYQHTARGAKHDGQMTWGYDGALDRMWMTWLDTFHMQQAVMTCLGEGDERGIRVLGQYEVGQGPAWSWRTEWDWADADGFQLRAFNISPEGQEDRAIEVDFARV